MPGVGQVLFRHKATTPKRLTQLSVVLPLLCTAIPAAAFALAGTYGGAAAMAALGLGLSLFFGLMALVFASARIVVSEGEVSVQLGMGGPRVAVADIESVALAPSGLNSVGMGIKSDLRGTTYVKAWGDNKSAVHIRKRDGKRLIVITKEADAMVRAIEEALRRSGSPRARVEIEADEPAADELEVRQEDHAERARSA